MSSAGKPALQLRRYSAKLDLNAGFQPALEPPRWRRYGQAYLIRHHAFLTLKKHKKLCSFRKIGAHFGTKTSSFFIDFPSPTLCFHRLPGFARKKTIFFRESCTGNSLRYHRVTSLSDWRGSPQVEQRENARPGRESWGTGASAWHHLEP
jgi:hypothetical protein